MREATFFPWHTLKSDEDIRRGVLNQIAWSPFLDAGEIRVSVNGGAVSLEGEVNSLFERRAATENAFGEAPHGWTMILSSVSQGTKRAEIPAEQEESRFK